jgi:DNA polymerase-1
MEKLLLIDGSSLVHRAFYALPILSNSQGEYTNAVHGFMMMYNRAIAEHKPDYVVVCFDKKRITFRNRIDETYKATRKETPIELRGQFELIKQVLTANNTTWEEMDDYEADDLVGTLARAGEEAGLDVMILSGDKDLLQLVNEKTHVYLTRKGISDIERWDIEAVEHKYNLSPNALIDLKALMGDSSDNISGVPGVGEKTALKLLEQFTGIDDLYARIADVGNEKLRIKLADNEDAARRSYQLATICLTAPLSIDWQHYALQPPLADELRALYRRLELRQLLKGLGEDAAPPIRDLSPQPALFIDETDAPWPVADAVVSDQWSVVSEDDVESTVTKIKATGACALLGTWRGSVMTGSLTELSFATADGDNWCFIPNEATLATLKPILEDGAILKKAAFAKELTILLARHGITLAGVSEDVIIAAYLLNPAQSEYNIDELTTIDYEIMPNLAPVARIWPLAEVLAAKIAEKGMEKLYYGVELPLTAVLAKMELSGLRVEGDKLERMSARLQEEATLCQEKIFTISGHEFNLNSPKQLAEVLFEELHLPALKKTKTGYSTDAEVLEQLAESYEIAGLITQYRTYAKLKSTYTDGLRLLINPETGKLHTSFKQTVTATGRLSSAEPNLQNIPVRMEIGKQIREVFVPDSPENFLLAGDYNQIELRVLAHISGDERLIKAFLDGEDIHARTAAEVMNVPINEVTPKMRRQAKAVNFGIVYGISDYGLARDLGISRSEAGQYIAKYFDRYPDVLAYQKDTVVRARTDGYVSTLLGRRRYLPDLFSPNFNIRSFAERMAINTPIQGSAADIIKIAMVNIEKAMREAGLKSQMVLQVHDELIFDIVPEEKDILPPLVNKLMSEALQLVVPLTVDMKIGKDWHHMN